MYFETFISMTKSFQTTLSSYRPPYSGFYIAVPDEISSFFVEKDIKRFICKVDEVLEFPCALLARKNAPYYIMINKANKKKLDLEAGEELTVSLTPDTSKYGLPMPEEMEVLLQQDPEADKLFHSLTPGRQRSLLFMIGKPKSSAIRLNKALAICEYLKTTGGKVDIPEMNKFIQSFRKMM